MKPSLQPSLEERVCERLFELGLPIHAPDHPFEVILRRWLRYGGRMYVRRVSEGMDVHFHLENPHEP